MNIIAQCKCYILYIMHHVTYYSYIKIIKHKFVLIKTLSLSL